MSISFMLSLMLSSVAMVSLEKWIHNNVRWKLSFFLIFTQGWARRTSGSTGTVWWMSVRVQHFFWILKKRVFFSKNEQIFEILFTFLCYFEGSIDVEAVVGEDGTQWVQNNPCKHCVEIKRFTQCFIRYHWKHTQQVFGWPKVFVLVDPAVEDHQEDEDAVVGDERHPGWELTLILDVHEHTEQCDSCNAVAWGLE